MADFPAPLSREGKPPAPKPSLEKEKKRLGDVVPPLCASRLKPIRQKTKNAVVRPRFPLLWLTLLLLREPTLSPCFPPQVSILDTGEVCMELLKCHGGQERVKEVLQISCDGSTVSPLVSSREHTAKDCLEIAGISLPSGDDIPA